MRRRWILALAAASLVGCYSLTFTNYDAASDVVGEDGRAADASGMDVRTSEGGSDGGIDAADVIAERDGDAGDTLGCGNAQQACCGDAGCVSGTACVRGMCSSCGAAGEVCCAGSTCAFGSVCAGATGMCAPCGGMGQPCCTPGMSCLAGLACTSGSCACAGPPGVVDQSQLAGTSLVAVGPQTVGETFVAGAAGVLTGIEVSATSCAMLASIPGWSLELTVLDGVSGAFLANASVPINSLGVTCTGPALSATSVGPGYFDVSAACVHVTAGQSLAFSLVPTQGAGTPLCVAGSCVGWAHAMTCVTDGDCLALRVSNAGDNYPSGTLLVAGVANSMSDLAFKTFVRCGAGYAVMGTSCVQIPAPRPMAPLSTSTVTSRRPTLHWQNAAGWSGAHVELCADRACTHVLATVDSTGSSGAPSADLPVGVVYWHVFGAEGINLGTTSSPTWEFFVGQHDAPVDTSFGSTLDVNGDGYADLLVAADGVMSNTGGIYLYNGGQNGVAGSPSASVFGPDGTGGNFAVSIASAGDVNGDGFGDVIVGASGSGKAFVFLGGSGGLRTPAANTLQAPNGVTGSYWFGASVTGAGDFNGDGYGDIVVGEGNSSSAYVYFGGATGIAGTTPSVTLQDSTNSDFGSSVASAGDVNGDGIGDIAVAAINQGRVFVFLGGTTPSTSASAILNSPVSTGVLTVIGAPGDFDGDGYTDVAAGDPGVGAVYVFPGGSSGTQTSPTITVPAGQSTGFAASLGSAGDVNGDGYDDLVVGADFSNQAFVFAGGSHGLATTPLTSLSGAGGSFGSAVVGLGDVNGDHFADVAVGAYQLSGDIGQTSVFEGNANGVATAATAVLASPAGTNGNFGNDLAWLRGRGIHDMRGMSLFAALRPAEFSAAW